MDIVIITPIAQIVQRPMPLINRIVNDTLVHSVPNVQQTLILPFIMIFMVNSKLARDFIFR